MGRAIQLSPFAWAGLASNIDGVKTFTALPLLPAVSPSNDNHPVRKKYFDDTGVKLTGNQTVAGIKTFSSFPVTPSSAPDSDYKVANKKYVDDSVSGGKIRAWVNFDGTGTLSVRDSFNVSSVTDDAVGQYTVNFASSLSSADYAMLTNGGYKSGENSISIGTQDLLYSPTVDAANIQITAGVNIRDFPYVHVAFVL